jgi:hypothetical protein
MQAERYLHQSVCHYLKVRYPDVIFTSESSGLYVTPGQARTLKATRSGHGLPDVMVFYPTDMYHGLFLELKATNIYKKDGTLKKNDHTEHQLRVIEKLKRLGYWAQFVVGMDEAVTTIDQYIRGERMQDECVPGSEMG